MSLRKMRIAPEGVNIVGFSGLLLLISIILTSLFGRKICGWLTLLSGGWMIAVLQFFRDPERVTLCGERQFVSPADGRIMLTEDDPEDNPLETDGKKVSIFMSPLNVHVNRSPMAGEVLSVQHTPGQFISAFKPEASGVNERTEVVMKTKYGKIAFKQISGFLARRIVFHPQPGDFLEAGERVGMIKFGSRMDVFIPGDSSIYVNIGDHVAAGETILGEVGDG